MKSYLFTHLVQRKTLKVFTSGLLILYLCLPSAARSLEQLDASAEVISFTLIDAETDVPLFPLLDNHIINLAKLPTQQLNIRINVRPAEVGSVVILVNGQKRTENVTPYAAKGDNNGDYVSWTPLAGTYHLNATPFSQKNGKGTEGIGMAITFQVIHDPSRPELVVENYFDFTSTFYFLLEQEEEDRQYFTMKSSDNSILPTPAAITPIDDATNDRATWVFFTSSATQDIGYDIFVNTSGLAPGMYTATVIFGPVEGYDPEMVKVILEISAGSLPFIRFEPGDFQFAFAQNAGQETSAYTLMASDGNELGAAQVMGIDITTSQPAPWLSFSSASNFNTPYTFYISTDMPAGIYYAELIGKAFSPGNYKNAKATLQLVLNPAFKIAQFVLINADTDVPIFPLLEGATVAPLQSLNIQARTFPEVTGSVKIVVNGKLRIENVFPYAAFGDNNSDYQPWNPTPGNYHIMATPYTQKNAKGQAGEPLSLNFTVLSNGAVSFEGTHPNFSEEAIKFNVFPNPLVHETLLQINLPETEKVYIDLYDKEMRITRLFEGVIDAHTVTQIPVDAGNLQNGVYHMLVIAGKKVISKKLIVAK